LSAKHKSLPVFIDKRIRNTVQTDDLSTNLSILGELRLNKIDYICADISSLTGGFVWAIGKGLLGDLGDMDFSAIKNKSRSQGDVQMIMNVLTLVGNDNNSEIVSKIAYGLGTSDGISTRKTALDLVDNDLLADMETIDLSILGELRLNKIDYICADISSLTGGFVWAIGKGLLGDLGDMDFSAIKNKSRSQGDLNMIMNVLTLVGNDTNSNIISKIAYGLGTSDGISTRKTRPRLGR